MRVASLTLVPAPERPTLDIPLPLDRARERISAEEDERTLAALYAHPRPRAGADAWVRANMIASLDGAATGADRRSGTINGDADLRVFRVLRAARGQRADLELAVINGTGALPTALLDADRPALVVTVADRPDLDALRARIGADRMMVAGEGRVDLAAALAALAARGLVRA